MRAVHLGMILALGVSFLALPAAEAHTCDGGSGCGDCPDDGLAHEHRWRQGATEGRCFVTRSDSSSIPAPGLALALAGTCVAMLFARRR